MTTVKDIVKRYLLWGGYEGLARADCGCGVDDLFSCDTLDSGGLTDCVPAYKRQCGAGCPCGGCYDLTGSDCGPCPGYYEEVDDEEDG